MIEYLIALAIFWFFVIPKLLFYLSDEVSLFGLYHTVIGRGDNDNDLNETLFDKILKMWLRYINLSIPFIIGYFYLISTAFHPTGQDVNTAVYLSFLFSLITLISIRFLANPSEKHFIPVLVDYVTEVDAKLALRFENRILDTYKERMISFFFAFIGATLILLIVAFSYDILSGSNLVNGWYSSLSGMAISDFIVVLVCYLLILISVSALTEIVLDYFVPLRQFPIIRQNNHDGANRADPGNAAGDTSDDSDNVDTEDFAYR